MTTMTLQLKQAVHSLTKLSRYFSQYLPLLRDTNVHPLQVIDLIALEALQEGT